MIISYNCNKFTPAEVGQYLQARLRGAKLGGHGGPQTVPDEELQVLQKCCQARRRESWPRAKNDQEKEVAVSARLIAFYHQYEGSSLNVISFQLQSLATAPGNEEIVV